MKKLITLFCLLTIAAGSYSQMIADLPTATTTSSTDLLIIDQTDSTRHITVPSLFDDILDLDSARVVDDYLKMYKSGEVKAYPGYKVMAGTIRYDPETQEWGLINSTTHTSIEIDSVVTNAAETYIKIYTNTDSIVSFICGVDETFASAGLSVGSRVTDDCAEIYYYWGNKKVGGYVYYTTQWNVLGGNATYTSYSGGTLTLTHDSINAISMGVVPRGGKYLIQMGSPGYKTSTFLFYDYAGSLITTADTDMKFSFMRQELTPVRPDYNPDELDTAWIGAANIWFIGIFK